MMKKSSVKLTVVIYHVFFVLLTVLVCQPLLAQPTISLEIENSNPSRILPDNQADIFWILDTNNGLIKLVYSGSIWSIDDTFPIGDVRYMAGPDLNNRLYCTFGGNPAGIYVFDCNTEVVVDTIALNYYPKGIALSPDESKLYVAAWEWPTLQEFEMAGWPGGPETPPEYLDKGLLLEIEISTHIVSRSVHTGTLPKRIYYADLPGDDMILVSTGQKIHYSFDITADQERAGTFSILDIINVTDFSMIQPRLEVPSGGSFTSWPYDNSLVAFSPETLNRIDIAPPELKNGILLINPVTGTVSSSIPVRGPGGISGSWRLICSSIDLDQLYVCSGIPEIPAEDPYDWVVAIDRFAGNLLESYNIGPVDLLPSDVFETPCGDLIITALDGENGYVTIFKIETAE